MSRHRLVFLLAGVPVVAALILWRLGTAVDVRRHAGPALEPSPALAGSCLRVHRRAADDAWRWDVVDIMVDLARCTLGVSRPQGGGDRLERLLKPGALAAVNGGYFEADYRPTSWLRTGGIDLTPVHRTAAGGVVATSGDRVFVGPLADLPFDPDLAVQSAPLVVESDGAIGIHSDDGKRAARTVVCPGPGTLRFVLVLAPGGDGPTLLELSRWLAADASAGGAGCRVALNLDGGPSTGVVFAHDLGEPSSLPRAPIGYALVVVPTPG